MFSVPLNELYNSTVSTISFYMNLQKKFQYKLLKIQRYEFSEIFFFSMFIDLLNMIY